MSRHRGVGERGELSAASILAEFSAKFPKLDHVQAERVDGVKARVSLIRARVVELKSRVIEPANGECEEVIERAKAERDAVIERARAECEMAIHLVTAECDEVVERARVLRWWHAPPYARGAH
jgi:hypothetical protein